MSRIVSSFLGTTTKAAAESTDGMARLPKRQTLAGKRTLFAGERAVILDERTAYMAGLSALRPPC